MTRSCLTTGSPTCVLPAITRDATKHTCTVCGRVWRVETDSHRQRYWRWDDHTRNKPKP